MPRLIWAFAGRRATFLVLSCRGSYLLNEPKYSTIFDLDAWLYFPNDADTIEPRPVMVRLLWPTKTALSPLNEKTITQPGVSARVAALKYLPVLNHSADYMNRSMPKPTNWLVRPANTQISLCIRPVWSASSLSAWGNLGSFAFHWAHCKDWSDWEDAQADMSLRWAHHVAAHMFWSFGINGSGLFLKIGWDLMKIW